MTKNRWIVSGCFAMTLALPVRAFDSLDEIKADLAKCKNCPHRMLLQARLNYRLKMIQYARDWNGRDGGESAWHEFWHSAGHSGYFRLSRQQCRRRHRRECASPGG